MRILISADTYLYTCRLGMFFRVRGFGVSIEKDRPRLFAERIGFRRVYRFGRWAVEFLS